MKKRIIIFASGSGTNAQNIIEYFQQGEFAEVVRVLSNKKDAKVLDRAKGLNIKASPFTKDELNSEKGILKTLIEDAPDLIVLAGFLLMFPKHILDEFPNKVINIHPALLPKYGGKGMYGQRVHEAVVAANESETGITIHYVNERYDEGAVIFQKSIGLSTNDTPAEVAQKVHALEYEYFPVVIEELLRSEETQKSEND
ncbi:MAG: phosphoribosylglycinamide formyltransferase [Bacteroidota bacterium]